MKHLFANDDSELVAADTAEQAGRYYDCELGGEPNPVGDWSQVPDDDRVSIDDVVKTAKKWAGECKTTTLVGTTYH